MRRPVPSLDVVVQRRTVIADGHRLSYQEAGPADGPVVVLIHGLASDSDTWDRALVPLA
ncbi:MAG: Pimeloyl-ACP methyl ester carboxylesterase, partial [Pseudonocardiales bacterium]|nr:Pimeloyl-ACP methyl ester carboxylesterase [Pseudonocardiales bacterium]